jgi:hypothetical protein
VFACEVDDFGINVDCSEMAIRQEVAEYAECSASSEAKHEDRAGWALFPKKHRRSNQVPCKASEEAGLMEGGMDCPSDPKFSGSGRPPNLKRLEAGMNGFGAAL